MKTGFTNAAGYNIVTSAERNGNRVIAVTMGHNTAKLRDKKVADLMNQGLKKLALNNKVNRSNMFAAIEQPLQGTALDENSVQSAQSMQSTTDITETWGIQIGAFSNYAKARNYALNIKKEVARKDAGKTVNVEPYQTGAAIVYRSKIIGFEKNEAKSACNKLKKSNKSCIVVAANKSELTLANKF